MTNLAERGFGFITAGDAKEYFFRRAALDPFLDFDGPWVSERIQFEIETDPKGARAAQVHAA